MTDAARPARRPARRTAAVVLRRPLARGDWLAAAGAGLAVGAAVTYLAAVWLAREPWMADATAPERSPDRAPRRRRP